MCWKVAGREAPWTEKGLTRRQFSMRNRTFEIQCSPILLTGLETFKICSPRMSQKVELSSPPLYRYGHFDWGSVLLWLAIVKWEHLKHCNPYVGGISCHLSLIVGLEMLQEVKQRSVELKKHNLSNNIIFCKGSFSQLECVKERKGPKISRNSLTF